MSAEEFVRDLEYEANNKIENTDKIKCKNYKFCNKCVKEDIEGYFCEICGEDEELVVSKVYDNEEGGQYEYIIGPHGWCNLEMVENSEECPICFECDKTKIKFPSGCGHLFCVDCTKNILIWEEPRKDEPSYESYGCPPCPNGCNNPPLGKQCNCDEYIKLCGEDLAPDDKIGVVEKWRRLDDNNENFHQRKIEIDSEIIADLISTENQKGNMRCPLCRSKYYSKCYTIKDEVKLYNDGWFDDDIPERYYNYLCKDEVDFIKKYD